MNRLSIEQLKNIKNVEKIKLSLKINIFMLPLPLKRSKRMTEKRYQKYLLNASREEKLLNLIKDSIRNKYTLIFYNNTNKICKDISKYISTFVI